MMDNDEIIDLHTLLVNWFKERNKNPTDVISYLTSIWIGQMCLNNYDEKFVDETLKMMKKQWKNHPLSNINAKL